MTRTLAFSLGATCTSLLWTVLTLVPPPWAYIGGIGATLICVASLGLAHGADT